MKKFFILLLLTISQNVMADCVCSCINGKVTPICSNAIDLTPICAPQVCPIAPPSIQPIDPPTVPPIGTKSCTNMQVFNAYTKQYEWKLICH